MKDAKVVLAACLLFATGCASTQQRGWVGGSFVQAGRSFWGTAVSEKDISCLFRASHDGPGTAVT